MNKIPDFYSPTTVHDLPYRITDLVRPSSYLGDKRRDENYAQLSDRLQHEGVTSLNRQSDDDAERRRYSRLLNNDLCDDRRFIELAVHRSISTSLSSSCCFSSHYIIPSDGSQIAFKSASGHVERRGAKLGKLNDNKTPGIHIHASLAINADSGQVVGLSDLILFERSHRLSKQDAHRNAGGKKVKDFSEEDRETYTWRQGADNSRRILCQVKNSRRTHLFDRDGDSKSTLNHLLKYNYDEAVGGSDDFVIRCQYRKRRFQLKSSVKAPDDFNELPWLDASSVLSPKSRDVAQSSLDELLNEQSFYQPTHKVELRAFDFKNTGHKRRKRKKRKAKIKLKSLVLAVMDSDGNWHKLYVAQAWEDPSKLPVDQRKTAINWILLTNNPVTCFEQALEIVGYYRKRWHIEQLFRTVKKQGLQVESAQLGSPSALRRLIIMMMENAAKVLKLVGARSGETLEPITTVFDGDETVLLKRINLKYEGRTDKQKNPYEEHTLSYGAWIIARMGGWKGGAARLPGPVTMERGLDKFQTIFEAWTYLN